MIKVECRRCIGKGTLQAIVWDWQKPYRETCHICNGRKYVELDEVLWAPAPTTAEAELTALRERVAKALQYLDNTGRGATWREQQALEALRGR